MNIFILDTHPKIAARMLCDQHIGKMQIESCQMMCHNTRILTSLEAPYGLNPRHHNHPCTVWARSSVENFRWLLAHAIELAIEDNRRYPHRWHKAAKCIEWISHHRKEIEKHLPQTGLTKFAQAFGKFVELRDLEPVESYKQYYILDKSGWARYYHSHPPDFLIPYLKPTQMPLQPLH